MPRRPERLILIHGAWAGAWVWDGLVVELGRRGWRADALDLPGDGAHPIPAERVVAEDYHRCLSAAILSGPTPVALVGHSGGGMLVTAGAAAHPAEVSHGIWVAGMLLPDGRSFDDIQEAVAGKGRRFGVTPHVQASADGLTSTVPAPAAVACFFHDAPAPVAAAAAARLTPQPAAGRRLATPAGPAFDALPKLYVLASDDRSVLPQAQRLMCEGVPNLTVREIASGHAPQLTRPADLARMIDVWLDPGPS